MTPQIPELLRGAAWLWDRQHLRDLHNAYVCMRRSFELPKVPRRATVAVSADSRYKLYVNGELVSMGPARGFQERQPYDTVELAPFLRAGRNALCAVAHHFGRSNFQYLDCGYAGFILGGRAGGVDLSTNAEWRVRRCAAHRRHTALLAMTMGFQEHFDARLEEDGWLAPEFDDSSWAAPQLAPVGSMPWHSFEERGLPLLAFGAQAPPRLLATARGACAAGCEPAENVLDPWRAEERRWRPAGNGAAPAGDALLFKLPAAGAHGFQACLLDFGEETAGLPWIQVEGAAGGEVIDAVTGETLTGFEPDIRPAAETACAESFGLRLIARRGASAFESFHILGLRYLALVVRGGAWPLTLRVGLRTAGYPMQMHGRYASDNPTLNAVHAISVRAQRLCTFDAFVDCPRREQAQWWGDALVQAGNMLHLSGDPRVLARGIRQIGAQRLPNGLTYGHSPTIAHNCILPDFTLLWLVTHHEYYANTGELGLFREMRGEILGALGYFESAAGGHGLLERDPRYWLFLDWAEIYKDGAPAVYNLLYLYALRKVLELFVANGDAADARAARRKIAALEGAIRERLYDAKSGALHLGLDARGRPVRGESPHAATWLILCGLLPELHDRLVRELLLPMVAGPRAHPGLPSPYFMHYVFEALESKGRGEAVLDCIERWWGDFVRAGYTATPEVWENIPAYHSACHAWSAHPIIHLARLHLGVRRRGIGWDEIEFKPVFHGAARARGKVATPRGTIDVQWRRAKHKIEVRLRLPKTMQAHVEIAGQRCVAEGDYRCVIE